MNPADEVAEFFREAAAQRAALEMLDAFSTEEARTAALLIVIGQMERLLERMDAQDALIEKLILKLSAMEGRDTDA